MQFPQSLFNSLQGLPGFDPEAFLRVHAEGESWTSVRLNPFKIKALPDSLPLLGKVPWCETGSYLSQRPSFTFDPLFHAGTYYVQEASSMFVEQAVRQGMDLKQPLRVLDLCGAPGGKSTHLLSLISPESILVTNEVIRSRASVLHQNIVKWGLANVVVTNNDPRDFSRLSGYFDLILVDAPCSGSGLFRRDPGAIAEWSTGNVQLCTQRQQRILSDVLPALKPGGLLIYSTCSFSKEEDEENLDWIGQQGEMENIRLSIDPSWGITESITASGNRGYRFWPDKLRGEGFFLGCFRKKDGDEFQFKKNIRSRVGAVSKTEIQGLAKWMNTEGMGFLKNKETIHAIPDHRLPDIHLILEQLHVVNAGLRVGDWMRDKLVPDAALALSKLLSDSIPQWPVDRENAIRYLQRKEIAGGDNRGWHVVCFENQPLGWINVLPNRVNNYYPKEWRILREEIGEE